MECNRGMGMRTIDGGALHEEAVRQLGMQQGYRAIESFSGAGGLSFGLKNAGFHVAFAFDIDEKAVETYRRNLGITCSVADVKKLRGQEVLEKVGVQLGG